MTKISNITNPAWQATPIETNLKEQSSSGQDTLHSQINAIAFCELTLGLLAVAAYGYIPMVA